MASQLIRDALAATRAYLGEPPELGLVTFIDPRHVKPIMVRGKPTWGRTWLKAGFEPAGETQGGLLAFRIAPEKIPVAQAANPRSLLGLGLFDWAQSIDNSLNCRL